MLDNINNNKQNYKWAIDRIIEYKQQKNTISLNEIRELKAVIQSYISQITKQQPDVIFNQMDKILRNLNIFDILGQKTGLKNLIMVCIHFVNAIKNHGQTIINLNNANSLEKQHTNKIQQQKVNELKQKLTIMEKDLQISKQQIQQRRRKMEMRGMQINQKDQQLNKMMIKLNNTKKQLNIKTKQLQNHIHSDKSQQILKLQNEVKSLKNESNGRQELLSKQMSQKKQIQSALAKSVVQNFGLKQENKRLKQKQQQMLSQKSTLKLAFDQLKKKFDSIQQKISHSDKTVELSKKIRQKLKVSDKESLETQRILIKMINKLKQFNKSLRLKRLPMEKKNEMEIIQEIKEIETQIQAINGAVQIAKDKIQDRDLTQDQVIQQTKNIMNAQTLIKQQELQTQQKLNQLDTKQPSSYDLVNPVKTETQVVAAQIINQLKEQTQVQQQTLNQLQENPPVGTDETKGIVALAQQLDQQINQSIELTMGQIEKSQQQISMLHQVGVKQLKHSSQQQVKQMQLALKLLQQRVVELQNQSMRYKQDTLRLANQMNTSFDEKSFGTVSQTSFLDHQLRDMNPIQPKLQNEQKQYKRNIEFNVNETQFKKKVKIDQVQTKSSIDRILKGLTSL